LKKIKFFIYVIIIIVSLLLTGITNVTSEENHNSVAEAVVIDMWNDPIFNDIGKCESQGNMRAKNPTSSASGEFQFIWNTWYGYGLEYWGDAFYEKNIWTTDNRELAWYVYKKYGTRDWNASKHCWSK
jgi:hypothetical protein